MSTRSYHELFDPSEWVSQAEAARLRGVSRQAISKLVRKGRLRTLAIGGHILVSRSDIERSMSLAIGLSKEGEDVEHFQELQSLLELCGQEQRKEIFQQLRQEFDIHPIEREFHAPAELILEAIARSPDISKRGVRGLIAEAAFELYVVQTLTRWVALPVPNEASYDFLLEDSVGRVRVQIKTQRRTANDDATLRETGVPYRPMTAREATRRLPEDMYVVETQRTRTGKTALGEDTRPYRFGEFDILAVSMYPSTSRWDVFMYTVARWLLPRPENQGQLQVFQPVAMAPSSTWTDHFETCVSWLRSGEQRRVVERSE